ncbi:hypothetical protein Bbelb_214610 [Branchiostoma belcheri]|nr:hypothetical protein Bbelb_214610 [Branchiostoma belcheri]
MWFFFDVPVTSHLQLRVHEALTPVTCTDLTGLVDRSAAGDTETSHDSFLSSEERFKTRRPDTTRHVPFMSPCRGHKIFKTSRQDATRAFQVALSREAQDARHRETSHDTFLKSEKRLSRHPDKT